MDDKVEIDGAEVAYRVDGSGPALVLVSGTGGNLHSNWDHLMEPLAAHRRVIRVDYSGSGDTRDDGRALTVSMLAEQVLAAVRACSVASFDLLGYSLGSAVAAHITAEYPQLVRSLVLVAPFAQGGEPRIKLQFELWQQLIRLDPAAFARLVLLNGFSPAFLRGFDDRQIGQWVELIQQSNRWDGMLRQVELDARLDVSGQLARIDRPTLVIGCLQDYILGPEPARAIARAISGARYAELDAGHMAPFERPQELLQLVGEFLAVPARG
ncbi:alpha/beta hydrolase [Pusillimonas sp.]|uniref:alpha/beta fold hydrolase n=1 Tax=Pusillimonas sp. TaxID=3040095 RepID=UPI0029BD2A0A|nr:alpha/beta hydrolase [Pusillimonas sp.]MDX3894160.1 alpha/beta hydrolase [Pusillimonas sp.]